MGYEETLVGSEDISQLVEHNQSICKLCRKLNMSITFEIYKNIFYSNNYILLYYSHFFSANISRSIFIILTILFICTCAMHMPIQIT